MLVHLHGATNGLVPLFYRESALVNDMSADRPGFVYTMHDYGDELDYTISIDTIRVFSHLLDNQESADSRIRRIDSEKFGTLPHVYSLNFNDDGFPPPSLWLSIDRGHLCRHFCAGGLFYLSGSSVVQADAVSFVSQSMTSAIVEGRFVFPMKERVLLFLLAQARRRRFFGITNGIDLAARNPFTDAALTEQALHFPMPEQILRSLLPNQDVSTIPQVSLHFESLNVMEGQL
jgi:hypothetical protein